MRVTRLALVLAVLLLPVQAAGAVDTFGAPHRVGPAGCSSLVSAKGTDGLTRGYLNCGTKGYYVEGSGSSWRTKAAAVFPMAVAVGGTTTYDLSYKSGELSISSRSAGGTYKTLRRVPVASRPEGASLVASGGTWWAVWSVANGAGGFNLWEAHTLAGDRAAHRFLGTPTEQMSNIFPSLAYQSSTGTAVLAWTRGVSQGTSTAVMATSHGGAWSSPKQVDADGQGPIVVVSGSTVAIVDLHGDADCRCVKVGTFLGSTRGGFTRHVLALPRLGLGLSADMSDGVLAVSYVADSPDHSTKLLRVAERRHGSWSESTLLSSQRPENLDTQSVAGRARVFYTVNAGVLVRAQAAPPAPSPTPSARAVVSATPTRSAAPSPTPSATAPSPTPSPTASSTPLAAAPTASSSGSATKVLLGAGALALIGVAGLVLLRRRRRT